LKAAEAEMEGIMQRSAQEHPANRDQGARVRPLKKIWHFPLQRIIYVLLGAVGLLALIACFNVANLLLAKATTRQQEIALRTALGATRGQIIRQLLVESTLLSLLGGALGLLLGNWGTKLLAASLPMHNYRIGEIEVDGVVLAFAVALSFLTALVFGLAPAVIVSRVNLHTALKEGGRMGEGKGPHRLRSGLVVVQVALAVVLLTGAAFTVESFLKMLRADWGFRSERVLAAHLFLSQRRYPAQQHVLSFEENLRASLSHLPGVEAVATSTDLPLAGGGGLGRQFYVEGTPAPEPGKGPVAWLEWVSPNYFETLGIPLLRGRVFSEQDSGAGASVAVVNRALAQKIFAGENPLGKRLRILPPAFGSEDHGKEHALEIIGVAGNVMPHPYPGEEPYPHVWILYTQNPAREMMLAIRTGGDPGTLAPVIRKQMAALDPHLLLFSIRTLDYYARESTADDRLQVVLWSLFAIAAIFLAAIGIYGVLSYSVAQRTRDIAVQMALGAERKRVLAHVMAGGLRLALCGLALGLVMSWSGWRLINTQVYHISAPEPLVQLGVAVLLILVAVIACWLPARRATRVDPMVALRYE